MGIFLPKPAYFPFTEYQAFPRRKKKKLKYTGRLHILAFHARKTNKQTNIKTQQKNKPEEELVCPQHG